MIKYWRTQPGMPKLSWAKLSIESEVREELRKKNPRPVPGHCKPWIDAQTAGLIVPWPWPPVRINRHETGDLLVKPPTSMISKFAESHWSFNSGYSFRTAPNVALYAVPLPTHYKSKVRPVSGILETGWYPQPLFFVFDLPWTGLDVELSYGMPMVMLVPIVLDRQLEECTLEEERALAKEQGRYKTERLAATNLIWRSSTGQVFSRLYKEWSRRFRNAIK